ncbi:uncharacterized protein ZBAI_07570 [Zygosaccharomyces bailii ISA1307]|nr:uncharacterized protein ZBAI_07570 [Zygosaccharomyces bailii ISA1307]
MNVVTNERQDDLEKFTWTFVEGFEEEKIQLLEDSSIGKLSYFFVPYFSQKQWILDIVVSLGCTSIALSTQLMYFFLCENIYPGFEVDVSGIFSASWLIIYCSLHHAIFVANYIYCKVTVDIEMDSLQKLLEEVAEIDLAGDPEPWRRIAFRVNCWFAEDKFNNPIFVANYIYCKATVDIEIDSLQKLLEEVAEIDLAGDPEPWRRIAFRVNCWFAEDKFNNPIFYSGKQCRRFFVRDILRPMDPEPYKIGWFFEGKLIKTYCEDVLSRMLAQKAIANYRKNYPEEL